MSFIDIRDDGQSDVTKIKFDNDHCASNASFLTKNSYSLRLEDCNGCGETAIRPEAVGNLIKALNKAIELGWTKE